MKKNEIISLLKNYDLKAKKGFGQNFLSDENVLQKIVQTANLSKSDRVVEVGPGLGILTKKLAEKAKKITSVELDKSLIQLLENELCNFENVELVNMDALQYTPPKEEYKLIANIPYYITSPLISHFLSNKNKPKKVVLLIQKEVAEKICAKAKKLNVLGIHVQIFGTPKIISKVSCEAFYPAPKVDSAILSIDIYKNPLIDSSKLEAFSKIVHAGFSHKRKTILNSLTRKLPQMKKSEIEQSLDKCNIDPDARAQHLSIEDWNCLTNLL